MSVATALIFFFCLVFLNCDFRGVYITNILNNLVDCTLKVTTATPPGLVSHRKSFCTPQLVHKSAALQRHYKRSIHHMLLLQQIPIAHLHIATLRFFSAIYLCPLNLPDTW